MLNRYRELEDFSQIILEFFLKKEKQNENIKKKVTKLWNMHQSRKRQKGINILHAYLLFLKKINELFFLDWIQLEIIQFGR